MKYKWVVAITVIVVIALLVGVFSGFIGQDFYVLNRKPMVTISYPLSGATVSSLVMISGTASDPDKIDNVSSVEVRIGDGDWVVAEGTSLWSFDWTTYSYGDGQYTIHVRSYDGKEYSDVRMITVTVDNPTGVDSGSHQWAVFIAAANFPEENESKLGNGGLYLAENMAAYFIETGGYATSNVWVLFDDGWIRKNEGYGERWMTLQERSHEYAMTYGGATKTNVMNTFEYLINESNKYEDSEVFIWIFSHGVGESSRKLTGGKLLQSSEIFLWDDTVTDKELGDILAPLESQKVTILVDACYAGGFADRTIFDLPTSLLFRSGIPGNGRVVISGTSKFRTGFASTTQGPVFSVLWFEGLTTGDADGFRAGLFQRGVPRHLKIFEDGKVSVEEAFFYARYQLRTDPAFKEFNVMQPQMNDQYPHRGIWRSREGLILGSV
jgi:hypothetical protein